MSTEKEGAMTISHVQEERNATFNRVVARIIGKRIIYLLLGYREGNIEKVVGMRVAAIPRRYSQLDVIDFRTLSQALRENGLDRAADELSEAMNPRIRSSSALFEFKYLHAPEEITPS